MSGGKMGYYGQLLLGWLPDELAQELYKSWEPNIYVAIGVWIGAASFAAALTYLFWGLLINGAIVFISYWFRHYEWREGKFRLKGEPGPEPERTDEK